MSKRARTKKLPEVLRKRRYSIVAGRGTFVMRKRRQEDGLPLLDALLELQSLCCERNEELSAKVFALEQEYKAKKEKLLTAKAKNRIVWDAAEYGRQNIISKVISVASITTDESIIVDEVRDALASLDAALVD